MGLILLLEIVMKDIFYHSDDYSKLAKVYCIRTKSETYDCFVDYVNLVENMIGKRIKNLICDNDKEYMNKNIFIKKKEIRMNPCPPYVHELNGVAERYNRFMNG